MGDRPEVRGEMTSAVILAGGIGERLGSLIPKPFLTLCGKPVLQHSIDAVEPLVDEVVVVAPAPYRHYRHAPPGETRQGSIVSGLAACSCPRYVVIHDGVRPLATQDTVRGVLDRLCAGARSVICAVPVTDAMIEGGIPLSKAGKMLAQTPEGFEYSLLVSAYESTPDREYEASYWAIYEKYGIMPEVVPGVSLNTKLTFAEDLRNAELLLSPGGR